MKKIGFLTVDYDESKQETYKALELTINEKKIRFDSGDPIIDWVDYVRYLAKFEGELLYVTRSSSVDHWYMDGDKYIELHFDPNNDLHLLSREELMRLGWDEFHGLLTCVGTKDIKTFTELEAYCKKHKKKSKQNG